MRKFFGFLITLIILIGIIIVVLPLGMGLWLKYNYQPLFTRLDPTKTISVEVKQFNWGWFVSHATLHVTIKNQWLNIQDKKLVVKASPIELDLNQEVYNGPFILSKFGGDQDHLYFAKALIDSRSNNSFSDFDLRTLIGFSNKLDNLISVKNITIANNQQQFLIDGIKSKVILDSARNYFSIDAVIDSIKFGIKPSETTDQQTYQSKLAFKNMVIHAAMTKTASLWYGSRALTIDNATYFKTPNQSVSINQISLTSKLSQSDETSALAFHGHAFNVLSDWLNFNPVDIQYNITGLHTQSLSTLISAANKLRQSQQIGQSELYALSPATAELLSHGMTFKLDHITLGTDKGTIDIRGLIKFAEKNSTANLFALIANAQGELSATLPQTWITEQLTTLYQNKKVTINNQLLPPNELAQRQIQYWIENKKLLSDGKNLTINVSYNQGGLLINGLPYAYRTPQTESSTPTSPEPPAPKQPTATH